ncbi:hypothetical protein GA0070616_4384 [Micromonospora nigra]|uniref:Uncharacterized protein n=1 Tax=Micromonospora nigra TaxID=145857 RepID=A0A1C6SR81_9ACTN|nr:hypothetical protein [Micromonospora nigra]SCL32081.1 hypothetical protein GA0070616_4384 [Micromonospora nigra]
MTDEQLRRVAATRPGFATYPTSRPGTPSWWRRSVDGVPPGRTVTGRDVARYARQLGMPIEPWQEQVLDWAYRAQPTAAIIPGRATCCDDCAYWKLTARQAYDYHRRIHAYHGRRHEQWRTKADRIGRIAVGLWIAVAILLAVCLVAVAGTALMAWITRGMT